MHLQDCIVKLDRIFDSNLCSRLIDYINFLKLEESKIASGLDKNIRNVEGHFLTKSFISDIVYFKEIQKRLDAIYLNYKIKFPFLQVAQIKEMQFLKYKPGGKYETHTDDYHKTSRSLSCIINLNEDYEGGDFIFYDEKGKEILHKYKLNKGSVVFFPSNFLFPHKVEPIIKGTRYSIVIWLK